MAKVLVHFIVLGISFLGTWFILSRINFVELFRVDQISKDNERRLGELVLDAVKKEKQEFQSDSVQTLLNNIKVRLCNANDIEDSSITLHILLADDVNAFALPDHHLIIYTGLISYCQSPEELSGVLAHEISHIERHHVMNKLAKEIGLSMLVTLAGGKSSGAIMRQTAQLLSSTAFDREQEREADACAVHLMANANIDPEALANFLFRLSQEKDDIPNRFEWLSTHPNSQDRSSDILLLRNKETFLKKPIIDDSKWRSIKEIVSAVQENGIR